MFSPSLLFRKKINKTKSGLFSVYANAYLCLLPRGFRHDNNGLIKIQSLVAPAHILKTNERPELWQTEFPDSAVKNRLSFGSFGVCRELVMSSEIRHDL